MDGFSLFGHEGEDLCSQFGRMCRAFGINHMIAPTPQAKGKIERAMCRFRHRLVVTLKAAGGDNEARANVLAGEHIAFWKRTHANENAGEIPDYGRKGCLTLIARNCLTLLAPKV